MSPLFLTLLALLPVLADSEDDSQPEAAAAEQAPVPQVSNGLGSKQNFWRIDLGLRGAGVGDRNYAPYADNDAMLQGSLAASRTLWSHSRLSLAAGVLWDASSQQQATRGSQVSLVAQRFSATLEGRLHALPWLYVFARGAPGALWAQSTLSDQSSFAAMSGEKWGATFDASGGVSVLLLPQRASAKARWWLTFEAGYGWTQSLALTLKPQASAADSANVAAIRMPALSLNGPLYRITTGVSF